MLTYYAVVLFAAMTHPQVLRWSTVLFLSTFLITYVTFYNLVVVDNVFTREFFMQLIRNLIVAYFVTILMQHALLIVGIKTFPLLNLVQDLKRGVAGNSLSYEPSSAAIILSYAYLSLLRMKELDFGRKLTIRDVWNEERLVSVSFIYTMLGLVSGTAMIALCILVFYFLSPKQYWIALPLLMIMLIVFFTVDYLPLNRARESFLAFLTLDIHKVARVDSSAATRIIPMINVLTQLDLSTWDGWFGHGTDYGLSKAYFSERLMIGGIADYGFLSFLIMQYTVYKCMIKDFFSIETLLWIFVGMMTLNNVPLGWGAMMMFTAARHFQTKR
jgi:hypothetical protein